MHYVERVRAWTRLVDGEGRRPMSLTALISWMFVFGIPVWLVVEEVTSCFGIWRTLEARPG